MASFIERGKEYLIDTYSIIPPTKKKTNTHGPQWDKEIEGRGRRGFGGKWGLMIAH